MIMHHSGYIYFAKLPRAKWSSKRSRMTALCNLNPVNEERLSGTTGRVRVGQLVDPQEYGPALVSGLDPHTTENITAVTVRSALKWLGVSVHEDDRGGARQADAKCDTTCPGTVARNHLLHGLTTWGWSAGS